MPYKVENQFCDALNSDEYFYPELHKVTNFPEIGTCPWPAGIKLKRRSIKNQNYVL